MSNEILFPDAIEGAANKLISMSRHQQPRTKVMSVCIWNRETRHLCEKLSGACITGAVRAIIRDVNSSSATVHSNHNLNQKAMKPFLHTLHST